MALLSITVATAAAGGAAALTTDAFLANLLLAVGCQSSIYLFKRVTKPFLEKALLYLLGEAIGGDLLEHWNGQCDISYGDLLIQTLQAAKAALLSWLLKIWGESPLPGLVQAFINAWEDLVEFFHDLMLP
ncbi:MAG: hypothetical protein AAFV90_24050 [Cyanobacteria bacterium J06634_5]